MQAILNVDAAAATSSSSTTSPFKFLTKLQRFEEAGYEAEEEEEEEEVCEWSFHDKVN